ncbi:MAG: hypothetical protein M3406_02325 [Chloroflexota bacterium]|nr:hypothetical protein [Chloroflexota bacterium]
MRRWGDAAFVSARDVSERPELWLPGALAWIAGVGWIPFIAAVLRPPTVAELTFLGAGIVSAGSWPWNAVAMGLASLGIALLAFGLVAAGNATLLALLSGRRPSGSDLVSLLAVGAVVAVPFAFAVPVLVVSLVEVVPGEFNAAESPGGPVLRSIARVAPLIAVAGALVILAASLAAVAGAIAVHRRVGPVASLRTALSAFVRIGAPALAHIAASAVAHVVYLAFAILLLGVLWAPIGARLGGGAGLDVAIGLLLVGFVAIWLCLVLAGGALHAWSAATWSHLLAADASEGT